ncbi:MAG: PAS domain S-box protein [Deltaproteobacteria bacterium]|nr:PAS domain S-box protein [Deltaproteobacteria bacterium]
MNKKPTYEELEKRVKDLEQVLAERKKSNVNTLLTEARYRNILENIEDGYYETDLAGNFTFFNDALCNMFGRSQDEMLGLNYRDLSSTETAKKIFSVFNQVYRAGIGTRIIDYEVIRKDGSVVLVEGSVSLTKDSSGNPVGFCGIIRDRTEQKKIEETLRVSEAKYRHIMENIKEGYWEIDLEGKFTYINNSFAEICQASRDELIGLNPQDFTSSAESARITGIFLEIYQTGNPAKAVDYEVTRQDGSKLIVEMSISLLRNETGEPIGFCGISRDRTEKILAEKALRESEEKYRHILESINEGYYETDLRGNFTFCNKALCKMYGYSQEEMIGMNYRHYSMPETKKILYDGFAEVYRTGSPKIIVDHEVKRTDGTILLIETSVSLMRNDAGEPTGFHGMVRNRTEQRKSELALQQSEEKYRLLVQNAHDCIYVIQNGTIKFSNHRTEELTGYTAKELSETPFANLIDPKDRDIINQQQPKKTAESRQSDVREFRLIKKSRETLWVELNTIEIEWEGQPATLNFLRDMTAQKRAEAQFMQAQKMEAIGTLAGGVAHDFNNLLMTIQGNASLMLLNIDSDHPHYTRLKSIEQQVQAGADLTKQLLGAAKGGKYEVKPTNLNFLIEESLSLFGRTSKDITIQQTLEEPLWTVEVDRSQIEQVLLNLYVNAGHAMPGGGDLDVATQNVTLDEDYCNAYGVAPGKFVRISVTDNGVGMDEATQKRAFDPFFTTKGMGRGTGLGLASAYGIIKNHSGIINIYSEKGEGTTIRLYLPVSDKDVTEETLLQIDLERGSETVLFVDDQEPITELGRELLESMGYRVITAMSGKEALDIYGRDWKQIDLVILDMIMPGMSGGETFDNLKQINPEVSVLLASGYSINGQARTILDRGCRGFIQKPFALTDLSKKVRQILDGH